MKKLSLSAILILIAIISSGQPFIEVLSLNNIQSFPANSVKTIYWNSNGVENVRIEYAASFNMDFDIPNDWQVITNSTPASLGSFQWDVPNEPIGLARIRITDVSNNSVYDISDMHFGTYDPILTPKDLKITSPNGGEVLGAETSWHNITWKFLNTHSEVEVDYSTDNGVNWISIDTLYVENIYTGDSNVPTAMFYPSNRSLNWQVPNVNSDQCKIRVRDKLDNSIVDESDGVFSIESNPSKSIQVVSLHSAELLQTNATKTINWNSTGIDNVKIEYASYFNFGFDTPNDWQLIAASTPAITGSFDWVVPSQAMSFAHIRITDVSNNVIYDINDTKFNVYNAATNPKEVKITSPNGGEILGAASSWHNISLKSRNIDSRFEFDYSIDNGINWIPIDTLFQDNVADTLFSSITSSYNWHIPDVNSNQCKIRVRHKIDNSIFDESDNAFTIISNPPKSIEVLSFNSTEYIPINSVKTISWNSTGIEYVSIEYTSSFNSDFNSPNDWQSISYITPAENGSFEWEVNEALVKGRIRITDISDDSVYDMNDMSFRTYNATTSPIDLQITSPNGGEVLGAGTSWHNIAWKYLRMYSKVKFDYSIDNGMSWIPIDTLMIHDIPATEFNTVYYSYNWKVPNVNSDQCKVRIRSKTDNSIMDESDEVFTIIGDSTVGLQSTDKWSLVDIYPNPSDDYIAISTDSGISGYSLYSITGALVLQNLESRDDEIQIDIRNLNPGLYILNVITDKGVVTRKLVKH